MLISKCYVWNRKHSSKLLAEVLCSWVWLRTSIFAPTFWTNADKRTLSLFVVPASTARSPPLRVCPISVEKGCLSIYRRICFSRTANSQRMGKRTSQTFWETRRSGCSSLEFRNIYLVPILRDCAIALFRWTWRNSLRVWNRLNLCSLTYRKSPQVGEAVLADVPEPNVVGLVVGPLAIHFESLQLWPSSVFRIKQVSPRNGTRVEVQTSEFGLFAFVDLSECRLRNLCDFVITEIQIYNFVREGKSKPFSMFSNSILYA